MVVKREESTCVQRGTHLFQVRASSRYIDDRAQRKMIKGGVGAKASLLARSFSVVEPYTRAQRKIVTNFKTQEHAE